MSVTVGYKGDTLTTVSNETKTLGTKAQWMEDDITLTDSTTRVETIEVEPERYSISFAVDGEPTRLMLSLKTQQGRVLWFQYGIVSGIYDGANCSLCRVSITQSQSGGTMVSGIGLFEVEATYTYSNGTVTIAPVTVVSANQFNVNATYVVTYSYEP